MPKARSATVTLHSLVPREPMDVTYVYDFTNNAMNAMERVSLAKAMLDFFTRHDWEVVSVDVK